MAATVVVTVGVADEVDPLLDLTALSISIPTPWPTRNATAGRIHQLAFAMAVVILIDAFLARSLLVPVILILVGPVSGWPGPKGAAASDGDPFDRSHML